MLMHLIQSGTDQRSELRLFLSTWRLRQLDKNSFKWSIFLLLLSFQSSISSRIDLGLRKLPKISSWQIQLINLMVIKLSVTLFYKQKVYLNMFFHILAANLHICIVLFKSFYWSYFLVNDTVCIYHAPSFRF